MLRLQRSPSRICGGQSGTETVLCPYSPVFSLSLSLSFSVSASLSRTIRLQWVQVGFVVDKVARKQFSLHILQYFLFLPLPLSLSLIPFDCRAVQVGFVVDKVALKQFSLLILQYFLSLSLSHSIDTPYACVDLRRRRCNILAVGIVVKNTCRKHISCFAGDAHDRHTIMNKHVAEFYTCSFAR